LDLQGNEITISEFNLDSASGDDFTPEAYNVIRASANVKWAERDIKLETLYPVIYSFKNQYHASVPIKIIYDSFSSLTKAMTSNGFPLKLFDNNNVEIDNVIWEIIYSFDTTSSYYERKLSQMPQIKISDDLVYRLIAPSMYTGIQEEAYLKAAITIDGESIIVWTSPLII